MQDSCEKLKTLWHKDKQPHLSILDSFGSSLRNSGVRILKLTFEYISCEAQRRKTRFAFIYIAHIPCKQSRGLIKPPRLEAHTQVHRYAHIPHRSHIALTTPCAGWARQWREARPVERNTWSHVASLQHQYTATPIPSAHPKPRAYTHKGTR